MGLAVLELDAMGHFLPQIVGFEFVSTPSFTLRVVDVGKRFQIWNHTPMIYTLDLAL